MLSSTMKKDKGIFTSQNLKGDSIERKIIINLKKIKIKMATNHS
jgi:hypothetical protein